MARYSSDSDSDYSRHRRKHSRRSRSSSSQSSDSSSYRKRSAKYSKRKKRYRSRSGSRSRDREKSQKSHKSSRSSQSRDRDKYRNRYDKRRSYSSDHTRRKNVSTSRESSRSRSSSSHSNAKVTAGERPQTSLKDDFTIEARFKEGVLDEINSEGFAPKQFSSSTAKEKPLKNIVIDISANTIQLPAVAHVPTGTETIFHSSITVDPERRFDRWIKKLYTLRQKAIADLIHPTTV